VTGKNHSKINWEETTWEGNRLLQLRRSLALDVHQRLENLESMCDIYRHMQKLRFEGKMRYRSIQEKNQ